MCLVARLGHAGIARCLAWCNRYATPSRDNALPRALGNAIGPAASPRSSNQALNTWAVSDQSGTARSFRPFPRNCTKVLAPKQTCARQGCDFRDPRPTVIERQQQGIIPPPCPLRPVWRCEQGLHFRPREVADQVAVLPFEGNGEHPRDQPDTRGLTQGHQADEGADRRQTDIAGTHGVASLLFEVLEKAENNGGIHIGEGQRGGFNAGLLAEKRQEEPEGITTTAHRVRAEAFLVAQVVGKKRLEMWSK